MIAHYGCFEDVSAVIDVYPLHSVSCAACFKLWSWSSILVVNLCYGIKGSSCLSIFSHSLPCTGQSLSLTTSHLSYCIPGILALGTYDLVTGPSFPKQVAYSDSLAFQPPIQCPGHESCGVLWVFQPCLCICRWVLPLHHHPLWHVSKRMGIRLVPRGGRPGPESFKAIDTYTCSKNHTNSPFVCPRML